MSDTKQCPKCEGTMNPGVLQERKTYGIPPFVFAPEGESLPKPGAPGQRRQIVAYCCEHCGYIELYGVSEQR